MKEKETFYRGIPQVPKWWEFQKALVKMKARGSCREFICLFEKRTRRDTKRGRFTKIVMGRESATTKLRRREGSTTA